MTKVWKNILITLCGMFAFLFAGVFFVGCEIDYSKISLSADKQSVSLEVGESEDITFTIENYTSGFSTDIQFDAKNQGQSAVFEVEKQVNLGDGKIKVTITGVAGGQAQLSATTLEGCKTCYVDVSVGEYATSMEFGNSTLYVSNETAFVPSPNLFLFGADTTTHKDLSYYVLDIASDINFNTFSLTGLDVTSNTKTAVFSDGVSTVTGSLIQFDSINLVKNETSGQNELVANYQETSETLTLVSEFNFLAVYDYSVDNEAYDKILYAVSSVNVLPNIDMVIQGGYNTGTDDSIQVDFADLQSDNIVIVPNNTQMNQYILKLEMNNSVANSPLILEKTQSNEYIDVDFVDNFGSSTDKIVYYLKISQNSQTQTNTTLDLKVYYDIAQDIDDSSVNMSQTLNIEIQIAPTNLTVNGTTEPEDLTLYNVYKMPDFGWHDILIGVNSGYSSSPNYEGVYFTVEDNKESFLDMTYNGVSVVFGDSTKLYKDLDTPFLIRGQMGSMQTQVKLVVHLKSNILSGAQELTKTITCNIVTGAAVITADTDYTTAASSQGYFYVDADAGEQKFDMVLYADHAFDSISYEFTSGSDVISINTNDGNACIASSSGATARYYLNLSISPKQVGTGKYTIYLDNGTNIALNFSVIKTLSVDESSFMLANEGNEAVTNAYYSKNNAKDEFNNVLNIEILNSSTKDEITFGSLVYVTFLANTSKEVQGAGYAQDTLLVSKIGDNFRIATIKNGNTKITFMLEGYEIDATFGRKTKTISVYVNVSSYSLVEEFYLKNGADYALNNTVYYLQGDSGTLQEKDESVTLSAVANSASSQNFFQYFFDEESFDNFFEDADYNAETDEYSYDVNESQIYYKMVNETFNKKFIYFYAQMGDRYATTLTDVTITKKANGSRVGSRTITLNLSNGMMFWSEYTSDNPYTLSVKSDSGENYEYVVEFSNIFNVQTYGTFDMETFTYKNSTKNPIDIYIKANLRQRSSTMKYDAKISARPYQSVENISLATNVTKLNFSNNNLTETVSVSLSPLNATNKSVRAEFVMTGNNIYANMVKCTITTIDAEQGTYSIELSCQDFFEANKNSIVDITISLTGKVYIYPAEWGDSYTSIDSTNYQPVCIDVQYRNGSKANPYLLESADDVLGINKNETTLNSHYELNSVVDMTSVKDALPIGILKGGDGEYKLVGFSGSIVGTNSQAAISNLSITSTNFSKEIDGILYTGLFAQINDNASLENISFTGKIEFDGKDYNKIYSAILTTINKGTLENVGVRVSKSSIQTKNDNKGVLYYGAITAINNGKITQNFDKWAENNQTSKNLAFYNDYLTISAPTTNIYAGGIAGVSNGIIERILPSKTNSSYKLYGYSAYSAYTLITVNAVQYFTGYGEINVGGAVGVLAGGETYTSLAVQTSTVSVSNLLVGGEISSQNATGSDDAVGGIVGKADSENVSAVNIDGNISRAFVRANSYVGGITGYDYYVSGLNYLSIYGTDNKIEAVDDGRNNFYSAMIIKFGKVISTYLPSGWTDEQVAIFYAIGNYPINSGAYNNTDFDICSYLKRTLTTVTSTTSINDNVTSTADYYGDYLIVDAVSNRANTYYICNSYAFESKEVELGLGASEFSMFSDNGAENVGVYFMYYFAVTGRLVGGSSSDVQEEIEDLNFIGTNSQFYPFTLSSQDVNISSTTSSVLSVDINGNLTVSGTGLATITLTSILNTQKSRQIYILISNYFDKDVSSSLFYTSSSLNSVNVTNGSTLNIYGNSNANIFVVPSYSISDAKTSTGDTFNISRNGILTYQNSSYNLAKNTQITVPSAQKIDYIKTVDTDIVVGKDYYTYDDDKKMYTLVENPVVEDLADYYELDNYFSSVQINNQTIIFFKNTVADEGMEDGYSLVPMLQTTLQIDGKEYVYYYKLAGDISLNVRYRETATSIRTNFKYFSMQTNNAFEDSVTIVSTNDKELLFYQIFDKNGKLVQDRLPGDLSQFDNSADKENAWTQYINTMNNKNDLFELTFERDADKENVFNFTCRVLSSGEKFKNRFNDDIYGEYTVYLYASELENGVSYSFKILLDEAEINYVGLNNYSNLNDVSISDETIVPSQRGLIEIAIDPVEAVFESITISNNELNYQTGKAEASLTLAYEKITNTSKEFVLAQNFGEYANGALKFSYQELIAFINSLGEDYTYTGKIYVSYYMPSTNVQDAVQAGFDVVVTYGNEGQNEMTASIYMLTKLTSYAKLNFTDRQNTSGVYYVARGLSYQMELDYYGFSEDQISVVSSNAYVANIAKENGKYVLDITTNTINYENDIGFKVALTTTATKVVDDVEISTSDTIELYVMEYVLNYVYEEGVNKDIVAGMEDGVISTAIGNPYTLSFDIRNFLEYDASNTVVVEEVEDFVGEMTSKIEWKVYYNKTETTLERNKTLREDYYYINSYTVTPLKIYSATSDIYHFSANAYYTMKNGTYSYNSSSVDTDRLYTEFAFDVHQQSAQDSPIPIETYTEFLNMAADEWYILMNDIVIPSAEYASINGLEQFTPISTQIAGLDGNGYSLQMGGTYSYSDVTNIGVFASVGEDTILENVEIELTSDVVIKTSSETFDIGLLVAENAGKVTNCQVVSTSTDTSLSVVCENTISSAYVAGLVANNTGYITNSRSKINIIANINIAGLVGQNSGSIASSYYANASLSNKTNTTSEYTAGLVIVNSGEIHTSYVSGMMSQDKMYYDADDNYIQSNNNIAGFVYSNSGDVDNCYSNIQLRQSGAFASGFVFENSGNIDKCFSTSVLESQQTSNYGFARLNSISSTAGTITNCYYLSDKEVNASIGEINKDENTQIEAIKKGEFTDLSGTFSTYVVASERTTNSVWFLNEKQDDLSGFSGQIFNTGRPELVAPNIIATSQRELDRVETVVDETTGATYAKYIYNYTSTSATLGSIYNPILISDAETMEQYIVQENSATNYNKSYYRLISDIDYADYTGNGQTFNTKFLGYLEGNFMTISGIDLVSSESMTTAGLFAELGNSSNIDSVGVLMNFTFSPDTVSFANTNIVGGVVGKVDGGKLYNINLLLPTQDEIVVEGNNIVGGVVGMATGSYDMKDVYSQYSAKARKQNVLSNNFDSSVAEYSAYSFAGSVVGVLSGTGKIYNVITDTTISVLGDRAGLQFGLIDTNATATKVTVDMTEDMVLNAYSYGGFVVGQSRGILSDVTINGTTTTFTNIKQVPHTPTAIGGVVGLLSAGQLDKVTTNQSINVGKETASTGIKFLGGVAGLVSGVVSLSDITVNASLTAFQYVGGVAGGIDGESIIAEFEQIDVTSGLFVQGRQQAEVGMGGLAGFVGDDSVVRLEKKKEEAEDKKEDGLEKYNRFVVSVQTMIYVYGTECAVYVGGIVGQDKNSSAHMMSCTNAVLTGTSNKVYNLSSAGNKNETITMTVSETDGVTSVVRTPEGKESVLKCVRSFATSNDLNCYCNISFETEEDTTNIFMSVNMYGKLSADLSSTI